MSGIVGLMDAASRLPSDAEPEPVTADGDLVGLLARIAGVATDHLSCCDRVGVTVVERRGPVTPVATDEVAQEIESIQYAAADGPYWEAVTTGDIVRSDDLSTETRWAAFRTRARTHGIASVLSVRMSAPAGVVGALNFYSARTNAFDDVSEHTAVALADLAAIAIESARAESNVRGALATRDVIGQAKGVLMERLKVSADDAFTMLVAASQRSGRKLRDVAERVATTGEMLGTR